MQAGRPADHWSEPAILPPEEGKEEEQEPTNHSIVYLITDIPV